jgi:hypothetical protein
MNTSRITRFISVALFALVLNGSGGDALAGGNHNNHNNHNDHNNNHNKQHCFSKTYFERHGEWRSCYSKVYCYKWCDRGGCFYRSYPMSF